jgi:hypothetical protein
MTKDSPWEAKIDVSATNVAEAITNLIDGVTQAPTRQKLKELELAQQTQEKEIAAREAALREREKEQQIQQGDKQFELEQESRRLQLEKQRVALDKDRLENEKVRLAVIVQQLELQITESLSCQASPVSWRRLHCAALCASNSPAVVASILTARTLAGVLVRSSRFGLPSQTFVCRMSKTCLVRSTSCQRNPSSSARRIPVAIARCQSGW